MEDKRVITGLYVLLIVCFILFILKMLLVNNRKITKKVLETNELSIELETNIDEGYRWNYNNSDDRVIAITRSYKKGCSSDNCDGIDTYEIKGLHQGVSVLVFDYVDSSKNVIDSITYEIIVDENRNITENHYSNYVSEDE